MFSKEIVLSGLELLDTRETVVKQKDQENANSVQTVP